MVGQVQYAVLGATALVAVALAAVQTQLDRSVFDRYIGALNPVVVMVAVSAAAFASLPYLRKRARFAIATSKGMAEGVRFAVIVAPLFAVAAIAADLLLRYPEDMNVALPDAFFFYPAIAFLVEVCLHALPLALLIMLCAPNGIGSDRQFWALALPVALVEAAIQAATATTTATALFSGLQLIAFGLVQLHIFRRFGFMSMLGFRLVYYCLWHILWGSVRLELFF